ncbi:MAG: AMP-binding protein, partial [FCB group bacterium]|nr:AMP-binding protein [FCB group bacterium]
MNPLIKPVNDCLHASAPVSPEEFSVAIARILDTGDPETIHDFLDWGHLPEVSRDIADRGWESLWVRFIEKAINTSGYTIARLIQQRIDRYGDKPFLQTVQGTRITQYSYRESGNRINHIRDCLLSVQSPEKPLVVGLFTPNRLEAACVDLACLSAEIRVVPIPVNSSPTQLEYILRHAGITLAFIGGSETVNILRETRLSGEQSWVRFSGTPELSVANQTWEEFISRKNSIRKNPLPTDPETATILYTSGTTANPKGIVFSQTAMLTKRFARAVALPDLSSQDVFLAYLPLYHTFGRFFELMGALFWGATYTFAESPTFKTLLSEFLTVKPSVFISIPKRWVQIYEQVRNSCSFEDDQEKDIRYCLRKITGGRLKWGLSAAGYLDPDIFEFFQRHQIQLLSGYGMTEATGGITMTPPHQYKRNSVGKMLPGIEATLADDGELCIRGPYVCRWYFGNPLQSTLRDGWFHTGDIFKEKQGHYFIVDRKKEIYKNSRGQTIAPQKIENLFQDFEPIQRVFLVGDGLEFNTVLLYPNPDYHFPEDMYQQKDELRNFYSSLIQSVNSFLAPYERIVNFTLIDRDFSEERGELTKKGTFRRKVILEHFNAFIEPMYVRNYLSFIIGQYELRIPNWLTREWGVTRTEISWDGQLLQVRNRRVTARLSPEDQSLQLGNLVYRVSGDVIDINALTIAPELWLGNRELVTFLGSTLFRNRGYEPCSTLFLMEDNLPFEQVEPEDTDGKRLQGLRRAHALALGCYSTDPDQVLSCVEALVVLPRQKETGLQSIITTLILRCRFHPKTRIRQAALNAALPSLSGNAFLEGILDSLSVRSRADQPPPELDVSKLTIDHFHALLSYLESVRSTPESMDELRPRELLYLLGLLGRYGSIHPRSFLHARSEIVRWHLVSPNADISQTARREFHKMTAEFRRWLGPPQTVAVDPETGEELHWSEVVVFDDHIKPDTRKHILQLFTSTPAITEAIFFFTGKTIIRLENIAPQGVWVSYLGENHQKSVYRVLVQTHSTEAYNLVINMNTGLSPTFFADETLWLILMGTEIHGSRLVEMFGGYWPEFQLYTEEYIPGETVRQYLNANRQEISAGTNPDRWRMRWLHFIWNGTMAYTEFWRRSGFSIGFERPSIDSLIIPVYDYTTGTRLISITNRSPL